MTLNSRSSNTTSFSKLILFTVGSIIPFSISRNCFILFIFSLRTHLEQQGQCNGIQRSQPQSPCKSQQKCGIFPLTICCLLPVSFCNNFPFGGDAEQTGPFAWSGCYKSLPFCPLFYPDSGTRQAEKGFPFGAEAAEVLSEAGKPSDSWTVLESITYHLEGKKKKIFMVFYPSLGFFCDV